MQTIKVFSTTTKQGPFRSDFPLLRDSVICPMSDIEKTKIHKKLRGKLMCASCQKDADESSKGTEIRTKLLELEQFIQKHSEFTAG